MCHLRSTWMFIAVVLIVAVAPPVFAAEAPRRVLLVTHAGGYMHDSLLVAEQVLTELGPRNGFEVTCFRFTADPDARIHVMRKVDGKDTELEAGALEEYSARFLKRNGEPVSRQQCGKVNAKTLKNFDAVIFFTTSTWHPRLGSHPLTLDEVLELIAWVRQGGAFVGIHCATDTLYGTPYGELVGAVFDGHPWIQKVRLRAADPKHPAAKGLTDGSEIFDEIYQFHFVPYNRERLHIILGLDNSSIDVTKGNRTFGIFKDKDYSVSWCQQVGKGRSFYTSLGHHKEVWKDTRYQDHLVGGLLWALGKAEGDATPSAWLKK